MRFWLVLSWRYAWATTGMDVRVFDDGDEARRVALQYNAVLVEVFQREGDLEPHVDAHDWEFRDENNEPAPGSWVDVPAYFRGPHGLTWGPAVPPVVRVGRDISREEYEKMVGADEQKG